MKKEVGIQWRSNKPRFIFVIEVLVVFIALTLFFNPILNFTTFIDAESANHIVLGVPYLGIILYVLLAALGILSGLRYPLFTAVSINLIWVALQLWVNQTAFIINISCGEHLFRSYFGIALYLLCYALAFFYFQHSLKESCCTSSGNQTNINQDKLPILQIDDPGGDTEDESFYSSIAHSFADVIIEYLKKPQKASFSIGIDGRWGSGKTHFLNLLLNQIEKDSKVKIIKFNAWHGTDSTVLVKDFFIKWKEAIDDDLSLPGLIDNYVKSIVEREKDLFGTSFMSLLQLVGDSEDPQLLTHIKDHIRRRKNQRYCFVIDDVDRLDREELNIILKLCRVMADFPNTVYLIAYDRVYVDSILKMEATAEKSKSYLDKIVQLEFKVPHIEDTQFIRFLKDILQDGGRLIVDNDKIKEVVEKYNNYISYYLNSIRDIKRFSNSLLTRYFCVQEYVDYETFFLVTLIEQREKDLFMVLANNENQYEWLSAIGNTTATESFYNNLNTKLSTPLLPMTRQLLTYLINDSKKEHSLRQNFEYYLLGSTMSQIRNLKRLIEADDKVASFKLKGKVWLDSVKNMLDAIQFIGLYAYRFIKTPSEDFEIWAFDPSIAEHLESRSSIESIRRIIWLYFIQLEYFNSKKESNEILGVILSIWPRSAALINSEIQQEEWRHCLNKLPEDFQYNYSLGSDKKTSCLGIDKDEYAKNQSDVIGYRGATQGGTPKFFKSDGSNYAKLGKRADTWGDLDGAYWLHPLQDTKYVDPIKITPFEYEFNFLLFTPMEVKITILVDDKCKIELNKNKLQHEFAGFNAVQPESTIAISKYLVTGINNVKFYVINDGGGPTGICFRIDFFPISKKESNTEGAIKP